MTTPTGQHHLTPEESLEFEIEMLRREFLKQPPRLQDETLDRVRSILRAEAKLARAQHSELWRRARVVYGIDPTML